LPLLFNPFSTQPVEAAKVYFFYAITLLMIAGWVFTRRRPIIQQPHSLIYPPRRPIFILILIYLAIYTSAAIFSIDPVLSLWGTDTRQGALTVFALLVFTMLTAETVRSFYQVDRIITSIIIGSVPVAIYGCLQFFELDPLQWATNSLSPVHSTAGYSLYLGAYLAMAIPFTLSRISGAYPSENHSSIVSYFIILVLQTTCLLFTLSRSAVLAVIFGCLVFFVLGVRLDKKWRIAIGSAGTLIAGGIILFAINSGWMILPENLQAKLNHQVISETRLQSNQDRITIWKLTLPLIQRRFWTGYGPETYSLAFNQYYQTDTYSINNSLNNPAYPAGELKQFEYWDPHNLILSQILSIGIAGLLVIGTILSIITIRILRLVRTTSNPSFRIVGAALLGSMTAYLVQAQFNPSGFISTVIFWLVVGISAGITSNTQSSSD
jgi:O-antigen ligase